MMKLKTKVLFSSYDSPRLFAIGLIVLFCGVSVFATAQQNIALDAKVFTSKVSPWETLSAVNDGFEPVSSADKSKNAYGNWPSPGVWNWVEYQWDQYYVITQSEVYWWTDGGGIQIPDSSYMEYWDISDNAWKEMPNHSEYLQLKDQYSIVTFDEIYTKKIRIYCMNNIQSTGILEWKVIGELGQQIPGPASISVDLDLSPSNTSTVTIKVTDDSGNPVAGHVFLADLNILNDLSAINENYQISGVSYTQSALKVELDSTNAQGETSFEVVMPALFDPGDGINIQLYYNNGFVRVGNDLSFFESRLESPEISADDTDNTVDYDVELSYTDDPAWRDKVYRVMANGIALNASDYEVLPGKVVLKISENSILSASGTKALKIFAYGYTTVEIQQQINPGELSTELSEIGSYLMLTKSQSTTIYGKAYDHYKNPIQGIKVLYDIEIVNNNATNQEQYVLNNQTFTSSSSDNELGNTSDEGYVSMGIQMPSKVDVNDGIVIRLKTETGAEIGQIAYTASSDEKEIYLQRNVRNNPDFSWERTAQSENFILYWGAKINGNPNDDSNGNLKFDPVVILQALESVLAYWTDTIDFISNPDEGVMGKYKLEAVLNETWTNGQFGGWAFGGLADGAMGSMWIHPRAASGGVGALAHEFGHMCQGMILLQNPGYGLNADWAGFFWESHTCFMDWFYKDYSYNVGMSRYIMTSSMQYGTTRRHYQNVVFLQYLYDKYGLQTINDIWKKADPKLSHPLTSLRDSVLQYSQAELNDDFGYHAMRNVTWDYSNKEVFDKYVNSVAVDQSTINRRYTILEKIEGLDDWFIVPRELAPADYGFNIIPFYPDENATEKSIDFFGYENAPSGGAGWRYGIVAVNEAGEASYSDLHNAKEGTVNYTVSADSKEFYFVVSGAPEEHHNYLWEPGFPKIYRYPYKVRFNGALPAGHKAGYNSKKAEYAGAPHPNGGGWVAATANVASTVYVGPNAQVLGNASVRNYARIEDYAIVTDDAQVSGNAIVRDWALVGKNAIVKDDAIVEKRSRVYTNCEVSGNAVVSGSALVYSGSKVRENAVAKDLAFLYNITLSGTAVLGGDGEEFQTVSKGIYLQVQNAKGANRNGADGLDFHTSNIDVNPYIADYYNSNGVSPADSFNLRAEDITDKSVVLKWDAPGTESGIKLYLVLQGNWIKETTTSTSVSFTKLVPNINYTYRVLGIDSLGNYTPYSNSVTFKTLITSVSPDIQEKTDFSINNLNAQQRIAVIAPDIIQNNTLEIYSLSGRLVYKKSFVAETSVSHAEMGGSGIYMIRVYNGEKRKNSKIFIGN